jgi:hypothetical protein
MQYSLLIYQTDAQFADRSDPSRRDASNAAFGRYVQGLQNAGVLLSTLGIEPPEATTTVRRGTDAPRVEAGPFTDTKEQLGGICVIEVADADAARSWARLAPFDHCRVVEVRPTRVVSVA